jgi:hypothetical protein
VTNSRRKIWERHVEYTEKMTNKCMHLNREMNGRKHFGDLDVDGMDWIHLPQDIDQWRALANTVMSLPVP